VISFRSANFYLLLLFIAITFLSLLGIVSLSYLDIAAYACLFWGISFFYSSYLKQYQAGIVLSSALFLIGTILFVFTKYEILNFGNIFVPSALIIMGLSLIIANLLTKVKSISVIFSALSLFAGIWLLLSRGNATMDLYFSAVYELIKSYWIVFLLLGVVVLWAAINFKKRNFDQK
jgi:hypothetical protein